MKRKCAVMIMASLFLMILPACGRLGDGQEAEENGTKADDR